MPPVDTMIRCSNQYIGIITLPIIVHFLLSCRVGVTSFEDLDLKDLNPFFKGFEILLQKKDFGFGIDLNPFVFGQNPLNFNSVMCVYF